MQESPTGHTNVVNIRRNEVEQTIPAEMSGIEKMQLAVQIAAIVRASFKQATDSDVRDVLQMAASQLSVLLPTS